MARRKRQPRQTEPVILTAWHEHRSIQWPPGTRLDELTPAQAQRLYQRGKAEPAKVAVPESIRTPGESETPTDDGGTAPDGE